MSYGAWLLGSHAQVKTTWAPDAIAAAQRHYTQFTTTESVWLAFSSAAIVATGLGVPSANAVQLAAHPSAPHFDAQSESCPRRSPGRQQIRFGGKLHRDARAPDRAGGGAGDPIAAGHGNRAAPQEL